MMGVLNRGGAVRAAVVPDRKRATLHAEVRKNVAPGAVVYTDALDAYSGLGELPTRPSTTPSSTSTVGSARMALRTSGACSSGVCMAHT